MMTLPSPDVVALLQDLIRVPSVNPMGRDLSGPEFLETRLTAHLEQILRHWGLETERQPVAEGRDNLICLLPASDPDDKRLWLWEAHQDTVPVDGMTIDPFGGEHRDGRIYGRGACDVKGSMACLLAALRCLQQQDTAHPAIVLALTINEEFGFDGARVLTASWQSGSSRLLGRAPDLALVSEPTQLNVVVAHKGAVRWKISTKGQAAHSSTPDQGSNAVYRMAAVLSHLEYYAQQIAPHLASHPLLGAPSLSVGMIRGGTSINTVPSDCSIDIDRRLLPAESSQEARQHVIDFLEAQLPGQAWHEPAFLEADGLSDKLNADLARSLADVVRSQGASCQPVAVPFGTDAAEIGKQVPTVVFGPGNIQQAHTADEWISVDQLQQARQVLVQWATS